MKYQGNEMLNEKRKDLKKMAAVFEQKNERKKNVIY